ncbi:unnamed protein product [Urochloa decumbens]|uniref:Uncharacterized protein n=1 Tax=Urochloa decumbens TaxID=240449 RepID=A0ABC9B5I1_9POAL
MEFDHKEEQVHLSKKGGLQTIPFIIFTEGCERIVNTAVTANIIIYLTKVYHMGAAASAVIVFAYQAATNFLPIFGAILSDALLGRFLTISLTLFACTIGTVLLWLTTMVPILTAKDCGNKDQNSQSCHSPTTLQLFILLTSFVFLSIGASGVRPCSLPFGVDQFAHWSGIRKDRALKVLFSWYYVSMGGSAIISITLIVYLQDKLGWKIGFAISLAIMALATFVNIVTSPLYIKMKPQKSTWLSLVQVVFVATRNRHIQLPEEGNGLQYHNTGGLPVVVPSSKMRFLNKACVLRAHADSSNTEVLNSNSWNVCTVEQVEDLKRALSVIPMCSAMITSLLIQQATFRVLQAETMDRRVGTTKFRMPAGSIPIFEVITFTLWSGCFDKLMLLALQKITGRQHVLTHKQKMGIGVVFSVASALSASAVEAVRRKQAIRQGLENNADGIVNMSALWLAPQCVFAGLTSAFGNIGQMEFYYAVLPKTMSSLAMALLPLATGVANIVGTVIVKLVRVITARGGRIGWLPDNLNQGHYDYYYFLLAVLGMAGFIYFVACCYWFEEPAPMQVVESQEDEADRT